MSNQVRVEDMEVFSRLRAALLKFAQASDNALTAADSEISRMKFWLEGEQATHWQNQLRKRQEMVTQARDAVRQKKLYKDSSGRVPGAVEEEKHLARCLKALEEATYKIEAVKRWVPRLEKAGDQYRGGVSRMYTTLSVDVPRAIAFLDRLAGSLEEYAAIETSPTQADGFDAVSTAESGGMTRAPSENPALDPKSSETPKGESEVRHVADGQ